MMFANDIVLVEESRVEVIWGLDEWILALKGKGLIIRKNTTKYIR